MATSQFGRYCFLSNSNLLKLRSSLNTRRWHAFNSIRCMASASKKKRYVYEAGSPHSVAAELYGGLNEENILEEDIATDNALKKEKYQNLIEEMSRLQQSQMSKMTFIDQVGHSHLDHDSLTQRQRNVSRPSTLHTADRFDTPVEILGTPDPSVAMSRIPCPGCGAQLHCQDVGVPGYVPSEKFLMLTDDEMEKTDCQRCKMLKQQNLALNVSVHPEEYKEIVGSIKEKQGLVVIVVDLTDLPNSIYRALSSLVGEDRDVYVVGNKVDVLPKDDEGYLQRTVGCLQYYLDQLGFSSAFNIRHIELVSAKTGYGIETLVTKLLDDWGQQGAVYIVGCTNVGKSSLFNALLSSDYCRSNSRDFVSEATTSKWPGCTLNLLKFPIVNPRRSRLAARAKRINADKFWIREEEKLRRSKVRTNADFKEATLMGHIGQTFACVREKTVKAIKLQGKIKDPPSFHLDEVENMNASFKKEKELRDKVDTILKKYHQHAMETAQWCYDTPGVVNPDQIINLLTQKELSFILSDRLILPRTFRVRPGQFLFISGLGRIDFVKGTQAAFFTVFASMKLPIMCRNLEDFDYLYSKFVGTDKLRLPMGGQERIDRLPALVGKEFTITGSDVNISAADITLSSLGWVSVATAKDTEVTVRAYTPGGHGISMRRSLLRFALKQRGKLRGYGEFEVGKPRL